MEVDIKTNRKFNKSTVFIGDTFANAGETKFYHVIYKDTGEKHEYLLLDMAADKAIKSTNSLDNLFDNLVKDGLHYVKARVEVTNYGQ